jgi:hypothetical protein
MSRQSGEVDRPKIANGDDGLAKSVSASVTESYFHGTLEETEVFPVTEQYTYGTLESDEIRIFWMQMSDRMDDEIVGLLETVTSDKISLLKNDKQYTYVNRSVEGFHEPPGMLLLRVNNGVRSQ